jgi:hypothetical protein
VSKNATNSAESPMPSQGWPTTSIQSGKPKDSQPISALPYIPKKKGKGAGSVNSREKERLLKQLDVEPEALASQPQITPLLRSNGIRNERLIEVLRCDPSPQSNAFVRQWDELTPKQREVAGIEAIAVSVGILPHELWGLFAGATLLQGNQSTAVQIAMALPDVIRTTIKSAKTRKGLADREHLLKAARVLPTPKGSVTNINLPGSEEQQSADTGETLEDMDSLLKSLQSAAAPKLLEAKEE